MDRQMRLSPSAPPRFYSHPWDNPSQCPSPPQQQQREKEEGNGKSVSALDTPPAATAATTPTISAPPVPAGPVSAVHLRVLMLEAMLPVVGGLSAYHIAGTESTNLRQAVLLAQRDALGPLPGAALTAAASYSPFQQHHDAILRGGGGGSSSAASAVKSHNLNSAAGIAAAAANPHATAQKIAKNIEKLARLMELHPTSATTVAAAGGRVNAERSCHFMNHPEYDQMCVPLVIDTSVTSIHRTAAAPINTSPGCEPHASPSASVHVTGIASMGYQNNLHICRQPPQIVSASASQQPSSASHAGPSPSSSSYGHATQGHKDGVLYVGEPTLRWMDCPPPTTTAAATGSPLSEGDEEASEEDDDEKSGGSNNNNSSNNSSRGSYYSGGFCGLDGKSWKWSDLLDRVTAFEKQRQEQRQQQSAQQQRRNQEEDVVETDAAAFSPTPVEDVVSEGLPESTGTSPLMHYKPNLHGHHPKSSSGGIANEPFGGSSDNEVEVEGDDGSNHHLRKNNTTIYRSGGGNEEGPFPPSSSPSLDLLSIGHASRMERLAQQFPVIAAAIAAVTQHDHHRHSNNNNTIKKEEEMSHIASTIVTTTQSKPNQNSSNTNNRVRPLTKTSAAAVTAVVAGVVPLQEWRREDCRGIYISETMMTAVAKTMKQQKGKEEKVAAATTTTAAQLQERRSFFLWPSPAPLADEEYAEYVHQQKDRLKEFEFVFKNTRRREEEDDAAATSREDSRTPFCCDILLLLKKMLQDFIASTSSTSISTAAQISSLSASGSAKSNKNSSGGSGGSGGVFCCTSSKSVQCKDSHPEGEDKKEKEDDCNHKNNKSKSHPAPPDLRRTLTEKELEALMAREDFSFLVQRQNVRSAIHNFFATAVAAVQQSPVAVIDSRKTTPSATTTTTAISTTATTTATHSTNTATTTTATAATTTTTPHFPCEEGPSSTSNNNKNGNYSNLLRPLLEEIGLDVVGPFPVVLPGLGAGALLLTDMKLQEAAVTDPLTDLDVDLFRDLWATSTTTSVTSEHLPSQRSQHPDIVWLQQQQESTAAALQEAQRALQQLQREMKRTKKSKNNKKKMNKNTNNSSKRDEEEMIMKKKMKSGEETEEEDMHTTNHEDQHTLQQKEEEHQRLRTSIQRLHIESGDWQQAIDAARRNHHQTMKKEQQKQQQAHTSLGSKKMMEDTEDDDDRPFAAVAVRRLNVEISPATVIFVPVDVLDPRDQERSNNNSNNSGRTGRSQQRGRHSASPLSTKRRAQPTPMEQAETLSTMIGDTIKAQRLRDEYNRKRTALMAACNAELAQAAAAAAAAAASARRRECQEDDDHAAGDDRNEGILSPPPLSPHEPGAAGSQHHHQSQEERAPSLRPSDDLLTAHAMLDPDADAAAATLPLTTLTALAYASWQLPLDSARLPGRRALDGKSFDFNHPRATTVGKLHLSICNLSVSFEANIRLGHGALRSEARLRRPKVSMDALRCHLTQLSNMGACFNAAVALLQPILKALIERELCKMLSREYMF